MKPTEEMEKLPSDEYRVLIVLAKDICEANFEGHYVVYDKFQTESGEVLSNAEDVFSDRSYNPPADKEIGQKIAQLTDNETGANINITLITSNQLIRWDGVEGHIVVQEGLPDNPSGMWQFWLKKGEVIRGGLFADDQVDLLKWQTADLITALSRLKGDQPPS